MSEIYKFPNGGYDVVVMKRKDVLKCIDDNIIDKDIALDIIEHCELNAAKFLNEGRWTGIPYIGNIRVPVAKQMESNPEQQALIKDAKEMLDPNQYILFRKTLNAENAKNAKFHRFFNYMTSVAVNKNKTKFKELCRLKGEAFAKVYLFSLTQITAVENESIIEDNE